MSGADEVALPMRPVAEVQATLPADTAAGTRVVVAWFAALSKGLLDDALALMDPAGAYFLLRQRKTITNADFVAVMKGLMGPTFASPIMWSLGLMTEQDDRVAVIAGSSAPLTKGGSYENLYHFLFRVVDGRIVEGYEFADTFRSAQTFAAPPGEG